NVALILSALVPCQPGEKIVNYPVRPVDTTTDFEGTTIVQPPQQVSSGNAMSGSGVPASMVAARPLPRNMPPMVGMQRMPGPGMTAYNLASQAAMGGGMNPGGIPMQRGPGGQPHQQQQQLRRKDPGMGMPGYPQQKSRRF
ncbi:cyclin-dependent kinase E-1-like, partial [Thalictrum thalictroides]